MAGVVVRTVSIGSTLPRHSKQVSGHIFWKLGITRQSLPGLKFPHQVGSGNVHVGIAVEI